MAIIHLVESILVDWCKSFDCRWFLPTWKSLKSSLGHLEQSQTAYSREGMGVSKKRGYTKMASVLRKWVFKPSIFVVPSFQTNPYIKHGIQQGFYYVLFRFMKQSKYHLGQSSFFHLSVSENGLCHGMPPQWQRPYGKCWFNGGFMVVSHRSGRPIYQPLFDD
jgi:hypothetical protein